MCTYIYIYIYIERERDFSYRLRRGKPKLDFPRSSPALTVQEGATLTNRLAASRSYKHSWSKSAQPKLV